MEAMVAPSRRMPVMGGKLPRAGSGAVAGVIRRSFRFTESWVEKS
jgi:hypothetical protein